MSKTIVKLRVAEEITNGEYVAATYTPANGKEIHIHEFRGDAAFTKNSVVKLVWKYNHATESEEIIWSTKGSQSVTDLTEITDADGTRKIAVVCDNGESGPIVMSGFAYLEIY